MRTLSIPLMMVLGGLLTIGCTTETETSGSGNEGGPGGTPGTGGMGGMGGEGGSDGGSCGAEEPCDPDADNCYSFCSGLCSLPEIGFCGEDGACICICTEGECDRTDCTLVECAFGDGGDESCAAQGTNLCGGTPRDAICLDANGGTCDIVCASGVVTCAPDFM